MTNDHPKTNAIYGKLITSSTSSSPVPILAIAHCIFLFYIILLLRSTEVMYYFEVFYKKQMVQGAFGTTLLLGGHFLVAEGNSTYG
jgi:hypothetical protein